MQVSVEITDKSLIRSLRRLREQTPRQMQLVAEYLAAQGKEYARDIITQLIYATPQRSGYKRTRMLIRSIYSAVEVRGGKYIILVGASAHYAPYNELGTYDGYAGDGIAEAKIIAEARSRALGQRLILLEYGRPDKGLEPRPFILPAIIMVERDLPRQVNLALDRML